MPDINGMLFKRKGYKYAISLDLNMLYFKIGLSEHYNELMYKIYTIGTILLQAFINRIW